MRIFISVDMEGMPGIFSVKQTDPDANLYNEGREIMTAVTLAVVEELHNNGVEEVLISDSHDGMGNIFYERLPSYTSIVRGSKRPINMMYGIDRGFDAAIFLGYHAAAGTMHSNFDHTYSGRSFFEVKINGEKASEFYFNALIAGEYGVPVVLVGGDNVLRDEVKRRTPWAEYVVFKESITRHSCISPSLEQLRRQIGAIVPVSLNNIKAKAKPLKINGPIEVTFTMRTTQDADIVELIPGMRRIDAYSLAYNASNIIEAYKLMQVIASIQPQ